MFRIVVTSPPSAAITVPGAPTIGTATAGNAQASVTFTPPSSNGGAAITSYTLTSNPGGFTGSGASSPVVVTGLTNGTSYTFSATATNSVGTGPPSGASNAVTPTANFPAQIAQPTAFAGSSGGVIVGRFPPPSNYSALRSASAPVQSYTMQVFDASNTLVSTVTSQPFIVDTNTAPCSSFLGTITSGSNVITGITTRPTGMANGQPIIDRYGYFPAGTTVSSFTTSGTLTVTCSNPATGNDSLQRIGFYKGGTTGNVWAQLNAKCTATGLSSGTYTIKVLATNANGSGTVSVASSSITIASAADFYLFCGPGTSAPSSTGFASGNGSGYANGSVVGNHDFGTSGVFCKYGVAPGAASNNGLATAPTNRLNSAYNVWEANSISGSSASSQSYVVWSNPSLSGLNQNGILQMSAYQHLTLDVQPLGAGGSRASQPIGFYIGNIFRVVEVCGTVTSSSSGTTITDSTLALPAGTKTTGGIGGGESNGFGLANISTGAWSATGQSNTATTITMQNAITFTAGDFYSVSLGDVSCGKPYSNVGNGSIPSGWAGPTTMSQNAWNTYTVATSALDGPVDSITYAYPIVSTTNANETTGAIFKISFALNPPSGNANWYMGNAGWTLA